MPLPTVTSQAGDRYAVNSPQGRMIHQAAKNRAAKSAAESTGISGSSMSAGFIVLDKQLEDIKSNVISIKDNVNTMVQLAQSDARGDALRAADVPHDVQETAELAGMGGGAGDGGGGAGGGDDGGLGGLMGIGASIGSFGRGLAMWANPATAIGGVAFVAFIGLLIGAAWLGAKAFKNAIPDVVEGLEALSESEVDTEKVVQIAKALAAMGGALAAEGLGAALGSIGSLVSGVADGLSGLIGIDKRDPMAELKEFAQHQFSEDEIKQIELNARGLKVFGVAMAAEGIGSAVSSIAGLVSGVADGLRALIPVEEKDPMEEMWDFAQWEFTQKEVDQIKLNAAALIGFSTVMATVKTITVWKDIAELASGVLNFATSFFPEGKDPMVEMEKFASHEITQKQVDQITLNAKALVAFSSTMALAETMGTVTAVSQLFSGIATGISKLFGLDAPNPMLQMKEFAKHEITQAQADQIEINANALVNFSKAMALYSASGAAADALDLVGSMAKGITNFFGGTTGIDYEEIKTFAASDIGDLEPKITANATALSTFATAMKGMAGDKIDVEWKNIGANILGAIGGFFGGTAEENLMKNFGAIEEFTKTELDLDRVDNNIQAINKFMEFGASWADFKGGNFKAVGDFAEALVISANGIHTAMYGGTYVKPGLKWNMTIPDGKGLAGVQLGDMTEASMGIAVLRHSLTAQEPLQALQSATAAMDASSGDITIINANDNSSNSSSGDTNYNELQADHAESMAQMMFMEAQGLVAID